MSLLGPRVQCSHYWVHRVWALALQGWSWSVDWSVNYSDQALQGWSWSVDWSVNHLRAICIFWIKQPTSLFCMGEATVWGAHIVLGMCLCVVFWRCLTCASKLSGSALTVWGRGRASKIRRMCSIKKWSFKKPIVPITNLHIESFLANRAAAASILVLLKKKNS